MSVERYGNAPSSQDDETKTINQRPHKKMSISDNISIDVFFLLLHDDIGNNDMFLFLVLLDARSMLVISCSTGVLDGLLSLKEDGEVKG